MKIIAEPSSNQSGLIPLIFQKQTLLAAKDPHGCYVLFIAIEDGNVDMVKIFINAITDNGFSIEYQKELVFAKNTSKEISGFTQAMKDGHTEIVNLFLRIILKHGFSLTEQKEFFEGKRADGASALYLAMKHGQIGAMSSFVKAILVSDLGVDDKKEILQARGLDGRAGLTYASDVGNSEMVALFSHLISEYPDFSLADKQTLLAVTDVSHTPVRASP